MNGVVGADADETHSNDETFLPDVVRLFVTFFTKIIAPFVCDNRSMCIVNNKYTREAKIIKKVISNLDDTVKEVRAIVDNYDMLHERRYVGDMTGVSYIDALDRAVSCTTLTDTQASILSYMLAGYSVGDIVNSTGMSQPNISKFRKKIIRKIAYQYER